MLHIQENISLKNLTTFKIGGLARYFLVAKSEADLREAITFAKSRKLPLFILGGGSNLLISDHGFAGLVVKNEIRGIKFIDQDNDKVRVEIGAGENWDEVVALTVTRNLSGLENLSGIPGTVGGAAVQNAGAYGAELKDCLMSVSGVNLINGKSFEFSKIDCQYTYRDSVFKKNKKLCISSISLELSKKKIFNLEYAGLKSRLSNEQEVTIEKIRQAIIEIRNEKLPDWRKIGTAGSFFKNPIITLAKFNRLKEEYKELPSFPAGKDKVKVPLGWILDHVFKLRGYQLGNVGLYDKQALVIVNLGGASAKEVTALSSYVKDIVKEKIGVEVEEEVKMC